MNFWEKLNSPILCLAPMADVTDSAFRHVISKNSNIPHVTWTEFVSADGLVLAPEKGKAKLLKDLEYSEIERPIVAQLFSGKPEMMERAAALVLELGFDGLDINMGCPDKSVEKQGAGAGLIKNPKLAREIIAAAKRGVQNKIPVSVKTRLGYNSDILEEWLPELLAEEPAVITIHARTRKEMSKVPARWERLARAVEIRNMARPPFGTLIFGNGDVGSLEDAYKKAEETGCDGVMLGRAIFGSPFLFRKEPATPEEQLRALIEHIELFDKNLGGVKSFAVMKKHFKSYLSKIPNSKEILSKLMECEAAEEAIKILESII